METTTTDIHYLTKGERLLLLEKPLVDHIVINESESKSWINAIINLRKKEEYKDLKFRVSTNKQDKITRVIKLS